MMRSITSFLFKELPAFLLGENAWKTIQVFGDILDDRLEMAREALRLRWPNFDDRDDSLYLIGADRLIPRGIEEPSENYAERLRAWRQTHQTRGNAYNLVEQLAAYYVHAVGESTLVIRYCDRNGKQLLWEDGEIVESTYDPDVYTYASDSEPEQYARWTIYIHTGVLTPTEHQATLVPFAFKAAHVTNSRVITIPEDNDVWGEPGDTWQASGDTWSDAEDSTIHEVW